jgi:hypothetical protein
MLEWTAERASIGFMLTANGKCRIMKFSRQSAAAVAA